MLRKRLQAQCSDTEKTKGRQNRSGHLSYKQGAHCHGCTRPYLQQVAAILVGCHTKEQRLQVPQLDGIVHSCGQSKSSGMERTVVHLEQDKMPLAYQHFFLRRPSLRVLVDISPRGHTQHVAATLRTREQTAVTSRGTGTEQYYLRPDNIISSLPAGPTFLYPVNEAL